ncbi:competence protein ComJ [Falsibacillus pallidus]|uniref:Competence protein J (ComJ) n=1 Tax=Falsibacillus pallidus TaxID=493781 RepID=A0A370G786_9BACI|nr:competence protein ComJ [Falsibacillus pallidus]RDI38384.1 competence protein J (ComJ) [Falsibacillus pallidus]
MRMSECSFETEIFYSQIALFKYGLDNPFNDWRKPHVNQGFSWRDGSVSFGTLSSKGDCKITVKLTKQIETDDDVIRAIVVPFKVEKGGIEIGSVMETVPIDIPEGTYEVLFTAKNANGYEHYTFSFIENENPKAKVLKADDELNVPDRLFMEANPAI